jgi:hypothetical protein
MMTIRPAELSRFVVMAMGAALLLIHAGCQSTSPSNATATFPANSTASSLAAANAALVANPRPVVVRDFAFEVEQMRTEQGILAGRQGPARRIVGGVRAEETPAQKAARLAGLLAETIAKELTARKIPASREPPGAPLTTNGLLVGGEFLQVDEGNRLKRAIVGFGTGATEVLVQVAVYDLAQSREHPILVYGTGTGSKPMPGAIVMMNPYAMAAKYVLSRNATEKDVRNLGKQIARDLAQVEAGAAPKH